MTDFTEATGEDRGWQFTRLYEMDLYDLAIHAQYLEGVAEAVRGLLAGYEKFKDENLEEGEVPSNEDIYNFARMIMDHIPGLRDALEVLGKLDALDKEADNG